MKYILLLFVPFALSHICMIWPPQRGGWDAGRTMPGDPKCFQPTAPCGSVSPAQPTIEFVGGTTVYVEFQQNLNHYNPGWPGYMDVGYAIGTNQTSDDDFTLLHLEPDYWAHLQAEQTNFTLPVLIPNIDCSWCTLRVRYHPNKPTEPIFHNCADISISKNTYKPAQRVFALVEASTVDMASLSQIIPDGSIVPLEVIIHVLKRQVIGNQFLSNGLVTYHAANNALYFIGDVLDVFLTGNAPDTLYSYSITERNFAPVQKIKRSGLQWNALVSGGDVLYGIQQLQDNGHYVYRVSSITTDGVVNDLATTQVDPTDTYVNFFWATYDNVTGNIYILSGDENSLDKLDAVLYTVNVKAATSQTAKLDNSAFTLSNLYVQPKTGNLYSVSPGLYNQLNWSIVQIDPKTGSVTLKSKIQNSTRWKRYYGGGVYNGISDGQLLHMFKWEENDATALATIDIDTGKVVYLTDVDLGPNNMRKLISVVAVDV